MTAAWLDTLAGLFAELGKHQVAARSDIDRVWSHAHVCDFFMCCCRPMSAPAADETDGGSEVVRGEVHRKCDGHVSARARAPSCLALVDPLDAPHSRVLGHLPCSAEPHFSSLVLDLDMAEPDEYDFRMLDSHVVIETDWELERFIAAMGGPAGGAQSARM